MRTTILIYAEHKEKGFFVRWSYVASSYNEALNELSADNYRFENYLILGHYVVKIGDVFRDYAFGDTVEYNCKYTGQAERNQGFGGWSAPCFTRVSKYGTDEMIYASFHDSLRKAKRLETEFQNIAIKNTAIPL